MTYQAPPPLWDTFGTHAGTGLDVITSEETDEAGMPLWEQPVLFYDRQGKPLTIEKANDLLGDLDYKRLAVDTIGPYVVSTVWLGVDHGWIRPGPPVIFETMIFTRSDWEDEKRGGLAEFDVYRYTTEEKARSGHEEVCTLVRATYQPIDTLEEEPRES